MLARRADGDRRSHQPDGHQSAGRPERRAVRPAVPRHDRGVFAAAARDGRRGGRGARGCRFSTASTSPCSARATRRRRRFARSGRWAPTPSACRPCPKRSSRGTWASRCWAFRASPTWPPACFREPLHHGEVMETAQQREGAVHRAPRGHHWPALTASSTPRASRARARGRRLLAFQGRRRARDRRAARSSPAATSRTPPTA